MGKFVLSQSIEGFRFVLENYQGEIIGISPFFSDEKSCKQGMLRVNRLAPGSKVEDKTGNDRSTMAYPKYVVFKDSNDMFRYNLEDKEGQSILLSPAYTSLRHCLDTVSAVRSITKGVTQGQR